MRIVVWEKSNEAEVLRAAVQALRRGFLVAYPTETSYGLGADATQNTAVRKLFAVKGRSFQKPVHVVVSGEPMASSISQWGHREHILAETLWPGPLTLVLRARLWGDTALPARALKLPLPGRIRLDFVCRRTWCRSR
jgi:L-threonylcarbamoyladenylate synthase